MIFRTVASVINGAHAAQNPNKRKTDGDPRGMWLSLKKQAIKVASAKNAGPTWLFELSNDFSR
jgi:hypothetical protein